MAGAVSPRTSDETEHDRRNRLHRGSDAHRKCAASAGEHGELQGDHRYLVTEGRNREGCPEPAEIAAADAACRRSSGLDDSTFVRDRRGSSGDRRLATHGVAPDAAAASVRGAPRAMASMTKPGSVAS